MAACRSPISATVTESTKLAGKVAVVTGATEGIGRAIALALGKAGVKCAIGARKLDVLKEVAQQIVAGGGSAIAVQCDVTSREQVKNLVSKAEETFGPIDVLVNNAGVYYITFMKSLKEDWWEHTIDVNCKGVMNGIGAVLDGMVKRRSGHIVNISSDNGRIPDPGLAVYCGTKHFVEGMSNCLRKEVSGLGIKVTNIQPGWVDTPGLKHGFEPEAKTKFMQLEDLTMLQSEDIAQSVIYALSQPDRAMVNEIMIHAMGQDCVEK